MTATSSTHPRRLLLVTYQHPPMPFLGGDPWGGLATQLRRQGHELTIVTTRAHGALPTDAAVGVVRTPDLTAAGALRRVLRRPAIAREGDAPGVAKPPPALLTRVIVPTPTCSAGPRGRSRRCGGGPPPADRLRDHDLAAGSTHLVGLAWARRPAWLADFRDGWMFEALREPFPTAAQRRLDAWLERQVATPRRSGDRGDAPVGGGLALTLRQ